MSTGPFGGDVLIAIEKPLQLLEEVGKQLPFSTISASSCSFLVRRAASVSKWGFDLLFPSESIEQLRLLKEVGKQLPTFDEINERAVTS